MSASVLEMIKPDQPSSSRQDAGIRLRRGGSSARRTS